MTWPVRHLPVVQNWDCQGCTDCCREYQVHVTPEERQRITDQGWQDDADLAGQALFVAHGPWWRRQWRLNQQADGRCVFLNDEGRCRIHAKFGGAAKPLACRLYPFILVPGGDHWRVGLRYSCPAAAASQGRPLREHADELTDYAARLQEQNAADLAQLPPPTLTGRQRVDWPDLLRFVAALGSLLRRHGEPLELRWRKCLALGQLCRQARFDQVKGGRLIEFLNLVGPSLDAEVPPATWVPPPGWVGRVLFRQLLALYVRKDIGPERGLAARGRLALLGAAYRFARGQGPVPRVHARLPDRTFEQLEQPAGALPPAAEQVLERYYRLKVESVQFCGPTNFRLPFWAGLESLALTLPAILWLRRAFADLPPVDAVTQAVRIVDNNFGFNPLLAGGRQKLALSILARFGEIERLIAWYSR
jgi:lysine-N-methylase